MCIHALIIANNNMNKQKINNNNNNNSKRLALRAKARLKGIFVFRHRC